MTTDKDIYDDQVRMLFQRAETAFGDAGVTLAMRPRTLPRTFMERF